MKNKIFKKIKNFQITPVLRNGYGGMKLEGPIYIYAQEDIKINGVNFGKNFYLTEVFFLLTSLQKNLLIKA